MQLAAKNGMRAVMRVDGMESVAKLTKIPKKFYPLLRYDAVGLINELIPVNARAKALLHGYMGYKAKLRKKR
jgi:hypothetical protein